VLSKLFVVCAAVNLFHHCKSHVLLYYQCGPTSKALWRLQVEDSVHGFDLCESSPVIIIIIIGLMSVFPCKVLELLQTTVVTFIIRCANIENLRAKTSVRIFTLSARKCIVSVSCVLQAMGLVGTQATFHRVVARIQLMNLQVPTVILFSIVRPMEDSCLLAVEIH